MGLSSPAARDAAFDAAVDTLIHDWRDALDAIDEYQRRVSTNEALPRNEVRQRVLRYVAEKNEEIQWSGAIGWALGLGTRQVLDALEHWERQGAIEPDGRQVYIGGEVVWMVRINSHGRDLADGVAPTSPMTHVFAPINSTFYAPVQTGGHNVAHSSVTLNPAVTELITALQELLDAASIEPSAAAVEVIAASAQEELRSNGWTERVKTLLASLAATVQTTGALQPAYQGLRQLANAHGADLPPWPGSRQ